MSGLEMTVEGAVKIARKAVAVGCDLSYDEDQHALSVLVGAYDKVVAELKLIKDSSTDESIPFNERQFPTRQDMRVEIARLKKDNSDTGFELGLLKDGLLGLEAKMVQLKSEYLEMSKAYRDQCARADIAESRLALIGELCQKLNPGMRPVVRYEDVPGESPK